MLWLNSCSNILARNSTGDVASMHRAVRLAGTAI